MSNSEVKVWIDQDLCTGDGLCVDIEPAIFEMHEDGLAYVKEVEWPSIFGPTDSARGEPVLQMSDTAEVPLDLLASCVDAAEECPGECIFIEGPE